MTLPLPFPPRPALVNRRSLWLLLALLALLWSLAQAGVGQRDTVLINGGGWGQFGEFWRASLSPSLDPEFLGVMGQATLVTLAYGVCGTTLSLILGLGGGIVTSTIWWQTVLPPSAQGWDWGRSLGLGVRGVLLLPRVIHELIWGLLLLNILGLDPLVAVLAIALPFGAIVAKVFSEILDHTDPKPLHGLIQAGVPPLTAFLYGLLPQALPNLLSYAFYRFECSLRSAAVLGVIGAGGLGYEIRLSLQSLDYPEIWTGFYALMLLTGMVDLWSGGVRRQMGCMNRLDLNRLNSNRLDSNRLDPNTQNLPRAIDPLPTGNPDSGNPDFGSKGANIEVTRVKGPPQTPWGLRLSWGAMALAVPLSFWALDLDWSRLVSDRSRRLLGEMVIAAIPPWPDGETLGRLLHLSSLTLALSILAIALAGVGGIILSFPAAQTCVLPGGWLRPLAGGPHQPWPWGALALLWGSRLLLLLSRAIPAPIWALVFLFVLFPGILPGAIALGVHNLGILGRLMAEVNENLDDRPARSLHALGAGPLQVLLYGILPQNLGRFVAYGLYRWEVCLRETVIVGLVGAGGLGRLMTEQLSSFDYGGLTLTLICFGLLSWGVDWLSHQIRSPLA